MHPEGAVSRNDLDEEQMIQFDAERRDHFDAASNT